MTPRPRLPLPRALLRRWLRLWHGALHPYPPPWAARRRHALLLFALLLLSLLAIPFHLAQRRVMARVSLPATQTPLAATGAPRGTEVEVGAELTATWRPGWWTMELTAQWEALVDPGTSGPAVSPATNYPAAPPVSTYMRPLLLARRDELEGRLQGWLEGWGWGWWRLVPIAPREDHLQAIAIDMILHGDRGRTVVALWQLPLFAVIPAELAALALLLAARTVRGHRRDRAELAASAFSTRRCPECDYPVDGLPAGLCPECGWDHARRRAELAVLRARYRPGRRPSILP